MSQLTSLSDKRIPNIELVTLGFDALGMRDPIPTSIDEQITNTGQVFPDAGINGAKIESLSVGRLRAGTLSVDTYIQSTGYQQGVSGWRIDGQGNAEFNNITLTGGAINYGKTSFTDSIHAGYILNSSGVYFGTAGDTKYLKYNIATGALTVNGGSIDVGTTGALIGGQTAYNTGSGFFLGYSGGTYKLSIGDGTVDNSLTWDGSILRVNGSGVTNSNIFGSGEDGNVTISSNTSLTQDMYYNNLTVNGGFTLTTAGYRIFVKGTLTINATGMIAWNGNNGTGGTSLSFNGAGGIGGAALATTSLAGSGAGGNGGASGADGQTGFGGNGGNGVGGQTGVAVTHSFATSFTSTSGNSGAGSPARKDGNPTFFTAGATGNAGAAGALTSTSVIRPYAAAFAVQMFDVAPGVLPAALTYNAGCGGGGGAPSGASSFATGQGEGNGGAGGAGGGAGSGGGTIMIAARTIINNGSIQAVGGNGGNGGNGDNGQNNYLTFPNFTYGGAGGSGGGGGAGGAGGVIVLIYSTLSGSGTISVSGGISGNGGNAGLGGQTLGNANSIAGANGNPGVTPPQSASGKIIYLIV